MRVGVIFGGASVEHDVSIITALQAMAVLSVRHLVVPFTSREPAAGLAETTSAISRLIARTSNLTLPRFTAI